MGKRSEELEARSEEKFSGGDLLHG